MQPRDTSETGGNDLIRARTDGGKHSNPPGPLGGAQLRGAGGRCADVLDEILDEITVDDAELLKRLAL